VAEIVDVRWVAVAVASCRAVASPRWCRAIASHRVEQVSFRTYEGPVSFRVEEGAKWPGLTEFYSGPNLAERLFLVRPGLKPGLFDPGGTGQVPGQSGLTERGLSKNWGYIRDRNSSGFRVCLLRSCLVSISKLYIISHQIFRHMYGVLNID